MVLHPGTLKEKQCGLGQHCLVGTESLWPFQPRGDYHMSALFRIEAIRVLHEAQRQGNTRNVLYEIIPQEFICWCIYPQCGNMGRTCKSHALSLGGVKVVLLGN